MSTWDDTKIKILKENWGRLTASAIAEKIGGISRNAVIGKAHRLNLSAKLVRRSKTSSSINKTNFEKQLATLKHKSCENTKFDEEKVAKVVKVAKS